MWRANTGPVAASASMWYTSSCDARAHSEWSSAPATPLSHGVSGVAQSTSPGAFCCTTPTRMRFGSCARSSAEMTVSRHWKSRYDATIRKMVGSPSTYDPTVS